MSMQMLQCRCDGVDIPWLHDDSLNAIAHHVACLARSDLRQRARRCLICDFGAPLPLRRKNMHRGLVEIILRIAHESDDANIIAPKFLEIGLRFIVHETNQPKLGIGEIEAVPCFEHMLNAFSLDQCACKNSAELWGPRPRLETLHVHPARQIEEFFLRESADTKGLGCRL